MRIRYIETTGRCNLTCPFCVDRFRNFDMDDDLFYNIVDNNLECMKGQWLWLDFNGEPLLDTEIFERIRYLEDRGIKTQITTNGIILDEDAMIKLIDSRLEYIAISVLSLNPSIYKELRGLGNNEKIVNRVRQLKHLVDEKNSKLEIQAVAIDYPRNDLEEFVKYFHSIGVHVGIHRFTNRVHDIHLNYNVCNETKMNRGECIGIEDNLIVLSNGEVVFCCCDFRGRSSLGNLKDYNYSIAELMENGVLKDIISNQKNGIFKGICKECTDWIYHQQESTVEYVKEL